MVDNTINLFDGAASRRVLVPFEQYCCPKKMDPKRFFQCIFHIKTKLNSLQILQKQISFQKTQIKFTKASDVEIFGLVDIISPSSI